MTRGPLMLAIETSNPSAAGADGIGMGVALARVSDIGGLDVIAEERVARATRDADDLVAAVDRLFRSARLPRSELNGGAVAVSVGPGGFTSIRSSVAAGKMIAEATSARCVGVPTALVAAIGVEDAAARDGKLLVALASKRGRAWITVFRPGARADEPIAARVEAMALMGPTEVARVVSEGGVVMVADGFVDEGIRAAAEAADRRSGDGRGGRVVNLRLSAAACARASMGLAWVDPAALVPLYGREPEAVTLWRERRLGG